MESSNVAEALNNVLRINLVQTFLAMDKINKKCSNCKFGKNAGCGYKMYDKHHKRIYRTMKYTTNSKYYTHCDKWVSDGKKV